MTCKHFQPADGMPAGYGSCAAKAYGDSPIAPGICAACPQYDGPVRGAGDLAARAIKIATFGTIKTCAGCAKRAAGMNKLVPLNT